MANKEIVFPSGVSRRVAFRQEAGRRDRYFAPWALNVRLEDFTGRLRGGSWSPTAVLPGAATQNRYLTDGNGNRITDSDGNHILVGVDVVANRSGGVEFVDPGEDAPESHPAQCLYRARLIRPSGGLIFASRQGDYKDWDLSVDISDAGRAYVIQLAEAGEIGADVVSLIPHKDAYMMAATSNSLWVIQGDPTADGTLRNISREVGMVGAKAWCRDHLDRYYFLSSHGLYTVSASGEGLQAISENVIPEHLTGVNNTNTVLQYDHETRGVYIHIPDAEVSWLFDTERQGFWPFKVGYSGSHVAIGPIALGDGATFGRLTQIHGVLAQGSVNVTWRILVADTAEQVAENAKAAIESLVDGNTPTGIQGMGVWTGTGANHRSYPRARGKFMVLLLSANSGNWAWEGARCFIEPSGRWR
jgi:hypothetical protein